jgi:hypothetical protein
VRPEAVEALTQAEFVKITPAQEELVARATPDERRVAAVAIFHAREARRLLEEMGILKVPTVLDVTPPTCTTSGSGPTRSAGRCTSWARACCRTVG